MQPLILDRAAQPYVAIRARVTMDTIPVIAGRFPELLGWLAEQQLPLAGPPLLKYNLIDPAGVLEVEAAAPVAALPNTFHSDAIVSGLLPAGRYASLTHVGPYHELVSATGCLLSWATEQQLTFDVTDSPSGQRWGGRLEIYHTDPRDGLDPSEWTTELAFRLAE